MDAKDQIIRRQVEWAKRKGLFLQPGNNGTRMGECYTKCLNENLFESLGTEATREYERGDGTPLKPKKGRLPHLWALHNSDAIAANVFHYWKTRDPKRVGRYLDLDEREVAGIHFEHKFRILPRGKKPNIDVALRCANGSSVDWIGIESKMVETYPAKRQKLFDEKYFTGNAVWWDGLPGMRKLAETFRGDGKKTGSENRHLDRGQLIKHLLGLHSECRRCHTDPGRTMLVYLWFHSGTNEASAHEKEVKEFSQTLASDGVQFRTMTWQSLIQKIVRGERKHHPEYTFYLQDRYLAGFNDCDKSVHF